MFQAAIGQERTSTCFNTHTRTHATPPPPARQVIAKCETRQSLFNFRALVDASDAIIISRGNLGLDVVRLVGWFTLVRT